MTIWNNILKIKRGLNKPIDGTLEDGELGFIKNENSLCIGKEQPQGTKIIQPIHTKTENIDGILSIDKGGTGTTYKNAPPNSIIKLESQGKQFWYTPTADGAMYATTTNGVPEFGTLPIAQGGTGATNAATARINLGLGAVAIEDRLPMDKGGTGSTALADAPDGAFIKKITSSTSGIPQLWYTHVDDYVIERGTSTVANPEANVSDWTWYWEKYDSGKCTAKIIQWWKVEKWTAWGTGFSSTPAIELPMPPIFKSINYIQQTVTGGDNGDSYGCLSHVVSEHNKVGKGYLIRPSAGKIDYYARRWVTIEGMWK